MTNLTFQALVLRALWMIICDVNRQRRVLARDNARAMDWRADATGYLIARHSDKDNVGKPVCHPDTEREIGEQFPW